MKIRIFRNPRVKNLKAYGHDVTRPWFWRVHLPVRQTLVFVGPVMVQVLR